MIKPNLLLQCQSADSAKFDVANLISGDLTILFDFLLGVCSSSTTKSDATISSAILTPRESGCSSEDHRELCAMTSPNIIAYVRS